MPNLYAGTIATPVAKSKHPHQPKAVKSHTVYLAMLEREYPNTDTSFTLITTIKQDDKKLFVLQSCGTYYLSDEYILGEGIANILYSSKKLARVTNYGNQLIKAPL